MLVSSGSPQSPWNITFTSSQSPQKTKMKCQMMDDELYDPEKDYYAILGVEDDTNAGALRKSYHKLARIYHPDKQPPETRDEAHLLFVRLQNTHEVISDKSKRRRYDANRYRYYREKLGRHGGFGQRFDDAKKKLVQDELQRKNAFLSQKKRFNDKARHRQQEQDYQRQKQHEKHREEVRQRQEAAQSHTHVQTLREEKGAMNSNFMIWESKQRQTRENEVEARESEKRRLKEKHQADFAKLDLKFEKQRIQLQLAEKRDREAVSKKQEVETSSLLKRQEKERNNQKLQRKRIRR
ncbi:MAG: hypothetical protein SGARI_005085 [Bacillariaceae sp.]